jgi:hypothetical protein
MELQSIALDMAGAASSSFPDAFDPSLPSRLPALPSSVVMPALSIPASL